MSKLYILNNKRDLLNFSSLLSSNYFCYVELFIVNFPINFVFLVFFCKLLNSISRIIKIICKRPLRS